MAFSCPYGRRWRTKEDLQGCLEFGGSLLWLGIGRVWLASIGVPLSSRASECQTFAAKCGYKLLDSRSPLTCCPKFVHGPFSLSVPFRKTSRPKFAAIQHTIVSISLKQTQCASRNYGRAYSPSTRQLSQQQHSPTRCSRTRSHASSPGLTRRARKSLSTSPYVDPSILYPRGFTFDGQMAKTITRTGPIRRRLRCRL